MSGSRWGGCGVEGIGRRRLVEQGREGVGLGGGEDGMGVCG